MSYLLPFCIHSLSGSFTSPCLVSKKIFQFESQPYSASINKLRTNSFGRYSSPENSRNVAHRQTFRVRASQGDPKSATRTVADGPNQPPSTESEVDSLVGAISFGQLCDDFECISSPAVEQTARQLARDILEIRESSRLLSCFAPSVKYKDPLRSFTGRAKYRRPSWLLSSLDDPSVAVLNMEMQSSSMLSIKWKVRGRAKMFPANILGSDLVLTVRSTFKMNQISGQVMEHTDAWDLSGSDPTSVPFFFSSRLAWTTAELVRDSQEAVKSLTSKIDFGPRDGEIYSDPTDPRKFFQNSNPNSELYQTAFFIALIYLLVQTLKLVL